MIREDLRVLIPNKVYRVASGPGKFDFFQNINNKFRYVQQFTNTIDLDIDFRKQLFRGLEIEVQSLRVHLEILRWVDHRSVKFQGELVITHGFSDNELIKGHYDFSRRIGWIVAIPEYVWV